MAMVSGLVMAFVFQVGGFELDVIGIQDGSAFDAAISGSQEGREDGMSE